MVPKKDKNKVSAETIENLKTTITELDKIIASETDKTTITELETLKGELARVLNTLMQNQGKAG